TGVNAVKVLKPVLTVVNPGVIVLKPVLKVVNPGVIVLKPVLKVVNPGVITFVPVLKVVNPTLKGSSGLKAPANEFAGLKSAKALLKPILALWLSNARSAAVNRPALGLVNTVKGFKAVVWKIWLTPAPPSI